MNKKLFVGSLPYDVTEDQLHQMFAPCGQVTSARLITDKLTGQSRGFGFVEMASEDEAQAAIQKMNGTPVGSRQLVVNEAKPMENRNGGGFGGGNRSGGSGSYGRKSNNNGGGRGGFNR